MEWPYLNYFKLPGGPTMLRNSFCENTSNLAKFCLWITRWPAQKQATDVTAASKVSIFVWIFVLKRTVFCCTKFVWKHGKMVWLPSEDSVPSTHRKETLSPLMRCHPFGYQKCWKGGCRYEGKHVFRARSKTNAGQGCKRWIQQLKNRSCIRLKPKNIQKHHQQTVNRVMCPARIPCRKGAPEKKMYLWKQVKDESYRTGLNPCYCPGWYGSTRVCNAT